MSRFVVGRSLAEITSDMAGFVRELTGDTQFRWLGSDKGVIHLAAAAVINSVWDLWAKSLEILERRQGIRAQRLEKLSSTGLQAYTASVGWFAFSDEKVRRQWCGPLHSRNSTRGG
jgi:L-fuconate dehydratase